MAHKPNAAEVDRGAGREAGNACEARPTNPAGASTQIRFDVAELERIADWRDDLLDKIERLRWLLELFLCDGFSRAELEQLCDEVSRFTLACKAAAWRRGRAA